ncbi:hypothetical protein [Lysobacter enzymogenes]|uniref:Uncharacterized protein n=1 Tax=Lysobacter enzymogenes TaxID=69 RepID=A0A3N2RMW8_LYSEN|nr:hypothetical protein [Lysobacter enzymogenes]ROU08764.1 hypothetical protein D9T17_02950 [Lysobacter enzymogenes]
MSTKDSAHAQQWRDYRARRLQFLVVWFGGFVGLAVLAFGVSPLLPTSMAGTIFVAGGLAWLLGWVAAAIRCLRFPCPRCARPFLLRRPFSRECEHCGLARYE